MDNIELLHERIALLTHLPIVEFIPWLNYLLEPQFSTPHNFRLYSKSFWAHQSLHPGDFAQLPAQSPGVVGQGATL